jgi:hypothetical protein
MPKHRGPAWWLLYALVPLLAGLLVVEHRAPLSPGWHTGVQVSIVLCMYGLVWLWLRTNTLRLLWSAQGTSDRERVVERRSAARRSPRLQFTPRRASVIDRRLSSSNREIFGAKELRLTIQIVVNSLNKRPLNET